MHHLEEESVVISLAMTNLLQDNIHKREDDMKENEKLTTSYANSEPSLHNAPITLTENTGNANGATLTEGENCFNVLNFSTNHAVIEQLLVEPSLDLSLSHDNCLMFLVIKMNWLMMLQFYMFWNQSLVLKINMLFILLLKLMSSNCCLLYILWVTLNLMFCVT